MGCMSSRDNSARAGHVIAYMPHFGGLSHCTEDHFSSQGSFPYVTLKPQADHRGGRYRAGLCCFPICGFEVLPGAPLEDDRRSGLSRTTSAISLRCLRSRHQRHPGQNPSSVTRRTLSANARPAGVRMGSPRTTRGASRATLTPRPTRIGPPRNAAHNALLHSGYCLSSFPRTFAHRHRACCRACRGARSRGGRNSAALLVLGQPDAAGTIVSGPRLEPARHAIRPAPMARGLYSHAPCTPSSSGVSLASRVLSRTIPTAQVWTCPALPLRVTSPIHSFPSPPLQSPPPVLLECPAAFSALPRTFDGTSLFPPAAPPAPSVRGDSLCHDA
ncbi:hypothetical protein C8Q77DRAFT_313043 [Trametes polyzona]|nr:hypothetical protein C8Q77DRAFT_313043 [Trametes polyzona]